MPKLDGYGLLSALRKEDPKEADNELALIPVILISAKVCLSIFRLTPMVELIVGPQAGDEERVSGLLAGAEDYLSKVWLSSWPSLGFPWLTVPCTFFLAFLCQRVDCKSSSPASAGKKSIGTGAKFQGAISCD